MNDRYAHLRANLATHRAVTATREAISWCRDCEWHHADESGYCPLCKPAVLVATGEVPVLGTGAGDGTEAA